MKSALRIPSAILLSLLLWSCQGPQPSSGKRIIAKPAAKNLAAMEWVTGLHTHFIDGTGFEFRLIEVDGSGTVAMNPTYLYLVVTNNNTCGNEQSRMVALPQVARVEKVRFFGSEPRLQIEALLDDMNPDGPAPTEVPAVLEVSANITDGKIRGDIEVVVTR